MELREGDVRKEGRAGVVDAETLNEGLCGLDVTLVFAVNGFFYYSAVPGYSFTARGEPRNDDSD